MTNIPIIPSSGSIPRFLTHVQEAGIPSKVTNAYLKSVGLKSSNDAYLIPAFKALGFMDHGGVPTDAWRLYRDVTKSQVVLAEAIKSCYAGLFEIYSDAQRRNDEVIANWIRTNTTYAGLTVTRAVRTFKTLCTHADFDNTATDAPTPTKSLEADNPKQPLDLLTETEEYQKMLVSPGLYLVYREALAFKLLTNIKFVGALQTLKSEAEASDDGPNKS